MKNINSKKQLITKKTSECLDLYFDEIKQIKPLTLEEEKKLFEEYKNTKSEIVKEKLVKNYLKFVVNVAKHYDNSNFYTIEDLISIGNIGLIKAIEMFDITKGYKFMTYAVWWIKQSIIDGIINESKAIKNPTNAHMFNKKFLKLRNDFFNKHGYEPLVEDLIDDLDNINPKILQASVSSIDENNFFSLSKNTNNDSETTYEDLLIDSCYNEESLHYNIMSKKINFLNLNKIEKLIIKLKYGLDFNPELSFNQISDKLKLSEEKIISIHDKGIKKILWT
jgi:RNA polymerase primary sigma factor